MNLEEIIPLECVLRLFLTESCYSAITFCLLIHPQAAHFLGCTR